MLDNNNNNHGSPENDGKVTNIPVENKLTKSQKIATASLAFFAFLVIILWVVQFRSSLKAPFVYTGNTNTALTDSVESEANNEEALKTQDTDKDGLTDYDELYFYKTSPYLEDSDSDGFKDKEETDNDKDPNCPAGRDCGASGLVDGDKTVVEEGNAQEEVTGSLNSLLDQFNYNPGLAAPSEVGTKENDGGSATDTFLSGQTDAATLRKMLLENGMKKELLDQVSDEELLKSFSEVMNK